MGANLSHQATTNLAEGLRTGCVPSGNWICSYDTVVIFFWMISILSCREKQVQQTHNGDLGANHSSSCKWDGNLAKQVSSTKYLMSGVNNPSTGALVLLVTKTCANPSRYALRSIYAHHWLTSAQHQS
jgi:hypothetical protein